jgi:hypothetical protein
VGDRHQKCSGRDDRIRLEAASPITATKEERMDIAIKYCSE